MRHVDRHRSLESQRGEDRIKRREDVIRHEIPAVAHAVLYLIGVRGRRGMRWAHQTLRPVGCHVRGGKGIDLAVGAHRRCRCRE